MTTLISNTVLDYVEYCEESISSIIWKNSRRGIRNSYAGSKVKTGSDTRFLVCINGIKYQVSRLVYFIHNPNMDQTKIVDHIDGNPLNNNINNLRLASISENNCNKRIGKNNNTGLKHISIDIDNRSVISRNRYCVCVIKDKIRYRRIFEYTEQGLKDAIKYRDSIVASKHKEFARFGSEFTGAQNHVTTKSPEEI